MCTSFQAKYISKQILWTNFENFGGAKGWHTLPCLMKCQSSAKHELCMWFLETFGCTALVNITNKYQMFKMEWRKDLKNFSLYSIYWLWNQRIWRHDCKIFFMNKTCTNAQIKTWNVLKLGWIFFFLENFKCLFLIRPLKKRTWRYVHTYILPEKSNAT